MIEFLIENELLILKYSPLSPWIVRKFETEREISIKRTFAFTHDDLLDAEIDEAMEESGVRFIFGRPAGAYFAIEPRVLGTHFPVFLYKEIQVKPRLFLAARNTSIFKKIGPLVSTDLYIGGEHMDAIPLSEFEEIVRALPNEYEIRKYIEARLGTILEDRFDSVAGLQDRYEAYLNRRISRRGEDIFQMLRENEVIKYSLVRDKLQEMLNRANQYNEAQWQREIVQIILLIYPKYIAAFEHVQIYDSYTGGNRFLDFMLVDAGGSVDIAEIKRPFANSLMSSGKYRDNHVPKQELSGTIMQIEKYISYLHKWGRAADTVLTNRYRANLPSGLEIRVTNPSGIAILGTETGLTAAQRHDFEIVRRKYKSVIDIITYDDLIRRINAIISMISSR